MPAISAASAPAITFICTTLMPEVRAPASLHRAALRASPVVDRRKFTMNSAMIDEHHEAQVGEGTGRSVANSGRLRVSPMPWFTKLGSVKTRFSMRSPKVSVTSAT